MAADAQAMDDDTTATSGQDDPEEVAAQAQEDVAPQASSSASGKALAGKVVNKILDNDPQNDPAQASLIAQYGLNAQQARALLKNARDTLAQNAPQMENLAAAQKMSNPGGWGNLYASSLGAASDKQQQILGQLLQYDQAGNDADRGALDARLKLMLNRNTDIAKLGPAAMRVAGGPDAQQKAGAAGQTAQFAEMLHLDPDSPEYKAFVEEQALGGGNKLPPVVKVPNSDGSTSVYTETRDANGVHLTPVHGTGTGQPSRTGLTGDDFLSTLPPTQAAQVKALADGRMAFPSGFALKSPYWQNMISSVSQYDPTFDAVNYNARSKTRADFTSGKSANTIKALNTAIGHAGMLSDQIDGTASHDFTPLNAVQNYVSTTTGDPGPTQFKQTAGALASELTNVFRGSGGAEADVKRYIDQLDVNGSTAQKKAALSNIVALMDSRLEAVGDQYNKGMGKTEDALTLLDPKAQGVFAKLSGRQGPATSQPAAAAPKYTEGQTASGPGGAKMIFTNGAWQPVGGANGKQ